MATPHVTGAAALYRSARGAATAADIKAAIMATAVPTASLQGKVVSNGRLDASGF
jgi:subtilisin family serine protease